MEYFGDYNTPRSFTISGTRLKSLSLSGNFFMTDLLETVDVSGCPALTSLVCSGWSVLKTVYVAPGQQIANLNVPAGVQIVEKP